MLGTVGLTDGRMPQSDILEAHYDFLVKHVEFDAAASILSTRQILYWFVRPYPDMTNYPLHSAKAAIA